MTGSNENQIHEDISSKTEKLGESPNPPASNTTAGKKKTIGKGGYQEISQKSNGRTKFC